MANKYEKKEWEDRQSQYPSRRKLIPTTAENIYDVERAEGDVTVPGNAFDAQNMNDFEDRVYDAFGKLDATDIKVLDAANVFLGVNVEEVLKELFTSASDGKKAFANAIGGSASSTFQALADLAGSIKQDRDSGKQLIANAIGATRSGTASASESFSQLANRIKNDKMSFWKGETSNSYSVGLNSKGSSETLNISLNFGFSPSVVLIQNVRIYGSYWHPVGAEEVTFNEISFNSSASNLSGPCETDTSFNIGFFEIRNVNQYGFDLYLEANGIDIRGLRATIPSKSIIYAFG